MSDPQHDRLLDTINPARVRERDLRAEVERLRAERDAFLYLLDGHAPDSRTPDEWLAIYRAASGEQA